VFYILVVAFILIKLRNYLIIKTKVNYVLTAIVILHIFIYPPIRIIKKQSINELSLINFMRSNGNFLISYPVNVYFAYCDALYEISRQKKIINAKSDFKPQVSNTEFDTYVVVIGESARRDAHHAYGFKIENTPFLSNIPKLQFNNYIAASGSTNHSLTNTLFLHYLKGSNVGNNVVDLANLAGFNTYWLSNQFEAGSHNGAIGAIGQKAKRYKFLNSANADNISNDDINLMPFVADAINDQINNKKVIFVHLYGSHFPFCKRTKNKFDVFYVDKNLSCYVHSIKQTDALLQEIYQLLQTNKKQTNKDWALMYFADHGLSAKNSRTYISYITHGDEYKVNADVPFVILNSKLTQTK